MKNSKNNFKKAIMLAAAGAIALSVILGQTFAQTNMDSNNNNNPPINQTTPGTTITPTNTQPNSNQNNNQNTQDQNQNNQNGGTTGNIDLSKTTIDDILVSDVANDQGFVLQNSKTKIQTNATSTSREKIFATVQIGHAVAGMKVMATLIYDQDKSQIGPVEATVETTADTTMVPFSFTTTTPPWLKGNYTIRISIGNNQTKDYHFTVE